MILNLQSHFSKVASVVAHSDFEGSNNVNDVAIITLESCLENNANPQFYLDKIMKLADEDYLKAITEGTKVTASGFGKQSETGTLLSFFINITLYMYIVK